MLAGWTLPTQPQSCPAVCAPKRALARSRRTHIAAHVGLVDAQPAGVAHATARARATAQADNAPDHTARAAALSRLLGLSQPRLVAALGRCPDLFALSPEALHATLEAVAELTGLQPHQLPQLASADPSLLLQPDRLKANMRGLAEALCVPPTKLPELLGREPCLLALSRPELEARLEALEELLIGPHPSSRRPAAVLGAVRDSPGALLLPEPWQLEGKIMALESALEACSARRPAAHQHQHHHRQAEEPRLPSSPPPLSPSAAPPAPTSTCCGSGEEPCSTSRSGAASPPYAPQPSATAQPHSQPNPSSPSSSSSCSCSSSPSAPPAEPLRRLLSPLLLARPSLLSTPPELLAGRTAHLAAKAGAPLERVLSAAAANPNLLAASSCHLDRHCTALAAALGPVGALPPYRVPPPPPSSSAAVGTSASSLPFAVAIASAAASGHACSSSTSSDHGSCCRSSSELAHQGAASPTCQAHSHAPFPTHTQQLHPHPPPAAAGRPPEAVAAAMLVAAPRLLGQQLGALVAKWQLLAALCGREAAPTWAARLAAATVPERAELLDLPYTVVARLRFLSDYGLQSGVDPLEAVRASDQLFTLQYPQFKQWLRG